MTEFEFEFDGLVLSACIEDADSPECALLLAHGAGADYRHAHMQSLAQAFVASGITTMRFNFPFKQKKRNRVDSAQVSIDCIVEAVRELRARTELPLFVGGHSFGGRMATHAAADQKIDCCGLVLCSFPLHPAGKPGTDRAAHFKQLQAPVLFLSGTRDALADAELLQKEAKKLPVDHTLHWLDTADHSFKILKRSRQSKIDVYDEAADAAVTFVTRVLDNT